MSDCNLPKALKDDIRTVVMARIQDLKKRKNGPTGAMAEAYSKAYEEMLPQINNLNVCGVKKGETKAKGTRKKTARNVWIGHCMRKPENGGLGKDMASCSIEYKESGEALLDKYNLRGQLENQ